MPDRLQNLKIAVLATDGFEQSELMDPIAAFRKEGAIVTVVAPAPKGGKIKAWKEKNWGEEIPVDLGLDQARAGDFDALLLPGGVINPDRLRMKPEAIAFVKEFFEDDKPVAAICHGPQILIEAGVVKGRTLTSWPSIRTDLKNAGAEWMDRETVVDGNLVTSRKPADIPAFVARTVSEWERVLAGTKR